MMKKNWNQKNQEETIISEKDHMSINQPTISEATTESIAEQEMIDLSNDKEEQKCVENEADEEFVIIDKNDIPIDEIEAGKFVFIIFFY